MSTCVYMCFVLANGSICGYIHVFLEFHTCIVVGTQCGFFPLCVANFPFVAGLLLVHYSAICVFVIMCIC